MYAVESRQRLVPSKSESESASAFLPSGFRSLLLSRASETLRLNATNKATLPKTSHISGFLTNGTTHTPPRPSQKCPRRSRPRSASSTNSSTPSPPHPTQLPRPSNEAMLAPPMQVPLSPPARRWTSPAIEHANVFVPAHRQHPSRQR